jgi:sporulation protein YtfJ
MESIRNMVDVNTIVGDTVVMGDTVIIPISKVSFGFVAGGGEYSGHGSGGGGGGGGSKKEEQDSSKPRCSEYPFAGGTSAGVSVSPMAFLVVCGDDVQLLPVQFNNSYERMIEKVPDLICELKAIFCKEKKTNQGSDDDRKEHESRRGKHNKFDEEQATSETYRPASDEL